jgi:hypothetical protein
VRRLQSINRKDLSEDLKSQLPIDADLSTLNKTLQDLLEKHAPLVSVRVDLRKPSPWYPAIAEELGQLKRERRQAERRWEKSNLTVHKQIYDAAKEKVTDLVHSAKISHSSSEIADAATNKDLFSCVDKLLGESSDPILPGIYDPIQMPGKFSDFFSEKIMNIREKFPKSASLTDDDNLSMFNGTHFTDFSHVSQDFVLNVMENCSKTYCDLDPFPTKLLFDHVDEILPVITGIVNCSLSTGIVPTDFKTAVVKPLIKKSSLDQNELKNYRPISNLPFLSKVLERIVLHQISPHLDTNKLLSPHQSAYRPGYSCETALLSVINNILMALDSNKVSVLLLLDLSAAFDTIDHGILLSRLEHSFGIGGTVLNWFRSYLTDRKQFVMTDGNRSPETSLSFGVPQGSVLGPILFIAYTTPLTNLIDRYAFHEMFADDTQVLKSAGKDHILSLLQTLSSCSVDIEQWMVKNKLKLNCDKTEAISFPQFSNDMPSFVTVGSENAHIGFSESVRDLGIYLDPDLSMETHVKLTCQSARYQLKRIGSIRPYTLASACILSRLDYCNSALYGCDKKVIAPLVQVQNSAARMVCRAPMRVPTTPLLRHLHWLPVEHRITFKYACICYKVMTGIAPSYLSDLVKIKVPKRSGLRSEGDTRRFEPPATFPNRIKHGQRSFEHSAAIVWNALPWAIRYSPSLDTFKSRLKTYLFSQHFG